MEKYKYFLQDLVVLLKEKLEQAKKNETTSDLYRYGISMGFYDTLDLIKSQAIAFGIPFKEIGLDNYILEKFL